MLRQQPGQKIFTVPGPDWGVRVFQQAGLPSLDFDEAACTFTAGMAKRSTGIFAAAPIVQGNWDGTGTPDQLTFDRGAAIAGNWYANIDPYQWSIVMRVTLEQPGNDGMERYFFGWPGVSLYIRKNTNGALLMYYGGQTVTGPSIAGIAAGTPFYLVISADSKNTLDGVNYVRFSLNGVHTFAGTVAPVPGWPWPNRGTIGTHYNAVRVLDAIIEGLTIYRRPLWDGDYGTDVGNGDEVALISAGVDPCTVTGSWDVVFCCPTNAAVGALVTGTGEAWSHPHAAAETNLTDAFCQTAYAASAWADQGTPVTPAAYEFDGAATLINCGSNAALDDLASQPAGKGTLTAEAWVRADGWGEDNWGHIFDKGMGASGWSFRINSAQGLSGIIKCVTTNGIANSGPDDFSIDGRWHHIAMTWDDATYNYPRLWVDGIEVGYQGLANRNGLVVSDAAASFTIGCCANAWGVWNGKISWSRLSNVIRYTSPFVPPPLTNPPAVDGNTVEQWNMQDCAGATATAQVNGGAPPGGCDGQITAGAGGWNCVKDMDDVAIGDRNFQWGYVFGSDAGGEGITQTIAGLDAGQDYVLRVPVNLGADSNGRVRIRVRDETNAAVIVDFDGPLMTGLHTGANNSATLIVAGARFPQSLIGAEVYNITDVNVAGTDCSHATITAVSGDGTTITAALAGGTDNDWDTNDVFRIVWHRTAHGVRSMPADVPWTEPFCFELPTIARNGVVADCVSISVKVLNIPASGTVMCHQVELQENLVDDPSLEAPWAGGPPAIPAGWANVGLDPGDIQTSSTGGAIIHSGAEAAQYNVGAIWAERIEQFVTVGADRFVGCGVWMYGDGGVGLRFNGDSFFPMQYNRTVTYQNSSVAAAWDHVVSVHRVITGIALRLMVAGVAGATGNRYADDVYAVLLDDVTLTAAAANQADSAEATGLRVDGRDTCVQPVPAGYFGASSGWMRWNWTPRHDAANLLDFDESTNPIIVDAWGNATNYIRLASQAANTIVLSFNDGGGMHIVNWNCAGQVVAGTTYLMEVRYTSGDMWLTQDSVERARITTPIAFATTPANIYWGSRQAGDRQVDAVYNEP